MSGYVMLADDLVVERRESGSYRWIIRHVPTERTVGGYYRTKSEAQRVADSFVGQTAYA